jgi:hypothetical protein
MEDVGVGERYIPINYIASTSGQSTQQMYKISNMKQSTFTNIK